MSPFFAYNLAILSLFGHYYCLPISDYEIGDENG